MLPSIVAKEMQGAVADYMQTTFPIATPYFQKVKSSQEPSPHALISELLEREGAVVKGPYLDIKLPFRVASQEQLPFKHYKLNYAPYVHQLKAFERLCAEQPRSTIVATGTGSGKTECFMLPVLDDALHRREPGIKTIIVYPMNALATDQARRFAKEIAALDTRLTVGLFVGGDEKSSAHQNMGRDHVITCKKTLRKHPPDILLTNYKMLDFLLIRPKDQSLWKYNTPGMLRYIVVDELHTFDGAQGTDLACLIRRLRDRLECGPELACVGTSATMGSDSQSELLSYASTVFASEFDDDSIIGEDRLSPNEYLTGSPQYFSMPPPDDSALDPEAYDLVDEYLSAQVKLWFPELEANDCPHFLHEEVIERAKASVRLGKLLHQHTAFHQLVKSTVKLKSIQKLAEDWYGGGDANSLQKERLIASITALISAARIEKGENPWQRQDPNDWTNPLLQVRHQLWLREYRRLVCRVPEHEDTPVTIEFSDDLNDQSNPLHLPLLHCRECHLAAWGAVIEPGEPNLQAGTQHFYEHWFSQSPESVLLVPLVDEDDKENAVLDFCPSCRRLQAVRNERKCLGCQHEHLIRVWKPNIIREANRDGDAVHKCHHDCPDCGAKDTMMIVGAQAPTLTGVMTGRLFGSVYNDDYKLIAFSDSVQDAAHRAGFLGANTWRTVLRQAMAGWLKAKDESVTLPTMMEEFPKYWRDKIGNDARFCGLFIAPNMEWLSDYSYLLENGKLPIGSNLPDLIRYRLAYECFLEFSQRAAVGRTLTRTGVAALHYDESLSAAIQDLVPKLREEFESLRDLTEENLLDFLLGWIHYLCKLGAIYLDGMDSLLSTGNSFLFAKHGLRSTYMPIFGRAIRPPTPITLGNVTRSFEPLVIKSRKSWSLRWLEKTIGKENLFISAEANSFFKQLTNSMVKHGWLEERYCKDEPVWVLNPQKIIVTSELARLKCDTCRHELIISRDQLETLAESTCRRLTCHGKLEIDTNSLSSVSDYGKSLPRRLVPHEHTGLLQRQDRERVEQSFIYGTEPWDINLLSATPTLEMGIDIGALSSVFLLSVPPAQANYLQRIGRAGRRDGNAMAVTLASGQNHDQYFYSDPLKMMAGSVHTPGVFLRAIAVLERQLIAYGFDRWVLTGVDELALPGELRKVIDAVENGHTDKFPYNLIFFVTQHRHALLSNFFGMFPELEDNERAYLEKFVSDQGEGSLSWRLINRLQKLAEERASLSRRINQLKAERERLKRLPEDDETKRQIDVVEQERVALMSLHRALNKQNTLNFFTDEGLLPNYAFPEEGVTLRSVIIKRRVVEQGEDEQKPYEKLAYSFQRPSQSALSELAPLSRFYAVSHELEVEQIDLQLSETETWRFCARCQYTERVDAGDRHSACPKCGDPQWADSAQKQQVLKLRQVYATVDDRNSRIGDDSETREPKFFNTQKLVDIPHQEMRGGFRLKSDILPFGFEYLQKVTLREVNFGPKGGSRNRITVAGDESSRQGFKICKHCGKVQKERWGKYEEPHAFSCKLKKNPELESEKEYFASLFLYRELTSEAIRILLPLSEVAYSDEKLHSFIAALNLGLKTHFQGDVTHLEVTEMKEPGGEGSGERVYLVVYDKIPGGTGYLKDLMRDPQNLMVMLEQAYRVLTSCACIDSEHLDGCYECILAYRNSRNMPRISRREASELLGEILSLREAIEEVESLGEISTNTLIESKLEQRFVDALGRLPGAQLSKTLVNGKSGHLLTLSDAEGRPMPWLLEHQVNLGPEQGVELNTRVDVILVPARAEDAKTFKPIAVYLDGLQYHHAIMDDDVAKRSALLQSGKYWVFSLNWDDLPDIGKQAELPSRDLLRLDGVAQIQMKAMYDQVAGISWLKADDCSRLNMNSSLKWLSEILRNPQITYEKLKQYAMHRVMTGLNPFAVKDAALKQRLGYRIQEVAPPAVMSRLKIEQEGIIPGGFMSVFENRPGRHGLALALPLAIMSNLLRDDLLKQSHLHLYFDDSDTSLTDEFKADWRAFWHAVNQLQFAPGFTMATVQMVEKGTAERIYSAATLQSDDKLELSENQQWPNVFEFSFIDKVTLNNICKINLPEPSIGDDLKDDAGAVVVDGSDIDLVWLEQKVAISIESEIEFTGWTIINVADNVVESLQKLKEQGVFDE